MESLTPPPRSPYLIMSATVSAVKLPGNPRVCSRNILGIIPHNRSDTFTVRGGAMIVDRSGHLCSGLMTCAVVWWLCPGLMTCALVNLMTCAVVWSTCAVVWWLLQLFDDSCSGLMTCAVVWWLVQWFDDLCSGLMTCAVVWWLLQWFDDLCSGLMTPAVGWWLVQWFDDLCSGLMTFAVACLEYGPINLCHVRHQ